MADLKFPCPSCQQNIVCDELWCGQEIQCPSCKVELVVPQKQQAASSLVPPPPPAGAAPKLSIGRHQPAAAAPPGGQRFVPGSLSKPPPPKAKKGQALKYVKIGVALAILGGGGYFGYDWWTKRQAKAEADAAAAKEAAAQAERAAAAPAAPKALPVLPATWTLDVDAAKIPEGQANGSIAGTNFVVDSAQITRNGTAQVLDLRQGAGPSGERGFLIYLHVGPGETLTGHTWTVSQEMKGAAVPQVLKRWKATPTAAMQQKFFSTGYAMKLELGQSSDGTIPGRIFLALPDTEQSLVAGIFKVSPPSTTEPVAQPVGVQAPLPGTPSGPDSAFQKRYGVRKR